MNASVESNALNASTASSLNASAAPTRCVSLCVSRSCERASEREQATARGGGGRGGEHEREGPRGQKREREGGRGEREGSERVRESEKDCVWVCPGTIIFCIQIRQFCAYHIHTHTHPTHT